MDNKQNNGGGGDQARTINKKGESNRRDKKERRPHSEKRIARLKNKIMKDERNSTMMTHIQYIGDKNLLINPAHEQLNWGSSSGWKHENITIHLSYTGCDRLLVVLSLP